MYNHQAIRDSIFRGLDLFEACCYQRSIGTLAKINQALDKEIYLGYALASSCVIAESYRALAEFEKAIVHYKKALTISKRMEILGIDTIDWYMHYRPRAEFGLFYAHLEQLSEDHQEQFNRFLTVKDKLLSCLVLDIEIQHKMLQSLYLRKLGYYPIAFDLNKMCYQRIKEESNHFNGILQLETFFTVDHILAYLLQLCFFMEENNDMIIPLVNEIYNTSFSTYWSKRTASTCILHFTISKYLTGNNQNQDFSKLSKIFKKYLNRPGRNRFSSTLEDYDLEKNIFQAAFFLLIGSERKAIKQIETMLSNRALCFEGFQLLKIIESIFLLQLFDSNSLRSQRLLNKLCAIGLELFDSLGSKIYVYQPNVALFCKEILNLNYNTAISTPDFWMSKNLQNLRAMTW